ncbi:MAG: metal ABC transporter substrate-binding protein [bacterium]
MFKVTSFIKFAILYLFLILGVVYSKAKVVFSIEPLFGIFHQIIGNKIYEFDYTILVQQDFDHHHFDMKPSMVQKIKTSNMVFVVGTLEIETKILNLVDKNKVFKTTEFLKTNNNDPHLWISVRNCKIIIAKMYEYLVKHKISSQEIYTNYRELYRAYSDLDKIFTRKLQEKFASKRNIGIFSYHNEFGYFSRDYNLNMQPLFEYEEDISPSAFDKILKKMTSYEKNYVILPPYYDEKVKQKIQTKIKNVHFIVFNSNSKDLYGEFRKLLSIME